MDISYTGPQAVNEDGLIDHVISTLAQDSGVLRCQHGDRLIVVHDELDLDLGRMRVKLGGGDNGHNGLKSIRKALNTGDYYRVRVGVGRPPGRQDPADFLLSNFPARERDDVEIQIGRAADAVESLIINGLDRTQSAYNC